MKALEWAWFAMSAMLHGARRRTTVFLAANEVALSRRVPRRLHNEYLAERYRVSRLRPDPGTKFKKRQMKGWVSPASFGFSLSLPNRQLKTIIDDRIGHFSGQPNGALSSPHYCMYYLVMFLFSMNELTVHLKYSFIS